MKKSLVLSLAAVAALSMGIAANAKTTTDYSNIEDVKICLIGSTSGGNFWGNIETGFNAALEEYGWEGVFWAPSANAGAADAAILDLAETALIQGYNVICPVMNDITIFEDFLSRAKDAGVLVLDYNANPGEEYVIAQVGIDSYESGHQQGEMIAKAATEKGLETINYVNMCSALSNTNQQKTKSGVLDALAENFEGEVVEVGEGESQDNAATGQDAIGALYIAHPEINTIVCCDQFSAVAAGQFVEENALEGQVIAFGLSLDADALLRVKSGSLTGTSSVDSVGMGGKLLFSVVDSIIKGEEFEYKNFPEKIWVLPEDVDAYAEANGIDLG